MTSVFMPGFVEASSFRVTMLEIIVAIIQIADGMEFLIVLVKNV